MNFYNTANEVCSALVVNDACPKTSNRSCVFGIGGFEGNDGLLFRRKTLSARFETLLDCGWGEIRSSAYLA
jgi:hypothetical protein